MTYPEAIAVLESEGLRVVLRPFGIQGWSESSDGRLRFEIGRASAGGDELSVRREGQGTPLDGGPVRWFQRPTLEELTALLVTAERRVRAGTSATLFDALLELDPR
jgi:hypothetical protein